LTLGEAATGIRLNCWQQAAGRTGTRFPLLIKLLDCADWLSLQVHPDDELARRLEGEGHYGKTEAWHSGSRTQSRDPGGLKPALP
jgi:mannose-6-phosphate isomerase